MRLSKSDGVRWPGSGRDAAEEFKKMEVQAREIYEVAHVN